MLRPLEELEVAIVGLGYVGLPLAVEFGKVRPVMGFDISEPRIRNLRSGLDETAEVELADLQSAAGLSLTASVEDIKHCDVFIIAVPTPIDANKKPDLTPILAASAMVGSVLKQGDLVIFESTVYPGATEEDCVPVLEQASQLKFNRDFFAGYSPERINPGDRNHRLPDIKKVTAGSTPEVAEMVDALYRQIVTAGTFKARNIRIAEAAKVIENTQRDLNIALVNELAMIFNKLDIDTLEVLEAAGTKWNFLPFRPGLVGGHCIGVDPYYLTQKAQSIGYDPEVILAGRRVNDSMGLYVAGQFVKALLRKNIDCKRARVLVMGLAFKENCPDIRNTKVVDVVRELEDFGISVDVYDPLVDKDQAYREFKITLINEIEKRAYDGVLVAVPHKAILATTQPQDFASFTKAQHVIYDLKGVLPLELEALRL